MILVLELDIIKEQYKYISVGSAFKEQFCSILMLHRIRNEW